MSQAILSISDLDLSLDDELILNGITCEIPQNQITVVVGPSGAGKSSMLKSIVKFFNANGRILYRSQSISELDIREFRREVIYVSQVPVTFPGSVGDNINWGRSIWELPDVSVEHYLNLVGLDPTIEEKEASSLSIGQQQRLHLARSLAMNPKVLLLDEPASSLDAISKESFEQLIFDLQDQFDDLSVVMITHDLNQAKRMADYAILIDKGQIKLAAPSSEFFDKVENLTEADMLKKLLKSKEGSS